MDFFDEQVLEMRQQELEREHSTPESGIYVNRRLIEFDKQRLFDECIELMLPKTFIDMPKAVAKVKYPSEYRPQVIKTSLDGTVNFMFNLLNIMIDGPDGLEEVAANFQAIIKQVNPVIKIHNYTDDACVGPNYRLYSYKSYAIDTQMYNMVCVTAVNDQILQGCFNCIYDDFEQWEDIAKQIFTTIDVL